MMTKWVIVLSLGPVKLQLPKEEYEIPDFVSCDMFLVLRINISLEIDGYRKLRLFTAHSQRTGSNDLTGVSLELYLGIRSGIGHNVWIGIHFHEKTYQV